MALPIKPHTRNLKRQWKTPYFIEQQECQMEDNEPEVVIT